MSSKYDHHDDMAGLMAEFDHAKAKSRERRAMLEEVLPALSFTAKSPDGVVEVAVNWEGLLTGLRIGDAARGVEPRHLADAVLRAYSTAQQAAARRAVELLPGMGGSNVGANRLRARQDFEPTVLEETPPASQSRDETDDGDDGDDLDDSDQLFLRG